MSLSQVIIKNKKTKNIGAIIYPYMYGNYGNILPIKKFADNNGIYLIEDLAPSLGIRVPVQKDIKFLTIQFVVLEQEK